MNHNDAERLPASPDAEERTYRVEAQLVFYVGSQPLEGGKAFDMPRYVQEVLDGWLGELSDSSLPEAMVTALMIEPVDLE